MVLPVNGVGGVIMAAAQAYAYKDHYLASSIRFSPFRVKLFIAFSSSLYALLLAGVAIDFPSGLIVGLVFCIIYGFGLVGSYLYRTHFKAGIQHNGIIINTSTLGSRPILHYFLLSYLLAVIIMILWIITVGGVKSRSQASA